MVPLSRFRPYQADRWANIVAGFTPLPHFDFSL
jgi:hypothetical protein